MQNVFSNSLSKPLITTALVVSMLSPSLTLWAKADASFNHGAEEFTVPRGTVSAKVEHYNGLDSSEPTEETWTPAIGAKAVNQRVKERLDQEEEKKKLAEAAAYSPAKAVAKFTWDVAAPFVIPVGVRIAGDIFLSYAGDYLPKLAEYLASGLSDKISGGYIPGLSHLMGNTAKGEAIRQMPAVLNVAEKGAGLVYLAGEKVLSDLPTRRQAHTISSIPADGNKTELDQLRSQELVSQQRQIRELVSGGLSPDEWNYVLEPRFETKSQEDAYVEEQIARLGGKGTQYDPSDKSSGSKAWKATKYGLNLAWTAAEPYVIPVTVRFAGDYTLGLLGPWFANRAGAFAEASFSAINKGWTQYIPGSDMVGRWISRHTAKGEFYRNAGSMLDTAEKYAAPTYRFLQKSASNIKSAATTLYEKAKPAAKKVASAATSVASMMTSSARSALSSLGNTVSSWFSTPVAI